MRRQHQHKQVEAEATRAEKIRAEKADDAEDEAAKQAWEHGKRQELFWIRANAKLAAGKRTRKN